MAVVVPVKKIIPTKDTEVCGGPRDEAEIRVGQDKGVQDAIVYLKGVTKGKAWGPPDAAPVLDNKACRFVPADPGHAAPARSRSTTRTRSCTTPTASMGAARHSTSPSPSAGDKVTRDLPRPGMVRVECDAHGWMLAHVFVADNPYYAMTGEDGSFSIADIPPGQLHPGRDPELYRRHGNCGDREGWRFRDTDHRA